MREYLSEETVNTTSVLLYRLTSKTDLSVEEFHQILVDRLQPLNYQHMRRFRGIYKTPEYGQAIVATGFECDPTRPSNFFDNDFYDEFYTQLADMKPHQIAIVCTPDYLARCAHTENAREALLCLDDHNEYIVTARKEVQKVVGGLPIINRLLSDRLENVA